MILAGKVALVTGGSRGLGRDLAALLLQEGAKVIVCSRSPEPTTPEAHEDADRRWSCAWYAVDLTAPAQIEEFASTVLEAHGHIDLLVNNAGYGGQLAPLWETDWEELEAHISINLTAPFILTKFLLPSMLDLDEAWIVNVASKAGKRGVPRLAAYSATKFALVGMGQALAKELHDTNVSCVTICPGGMDTEMRASLFGRDNASQQQSAMSVAKVIRDIVTDRIPVARGAEVTVREGRIEEIGLSPNY